MSKAADFHGKNYLLAHGTADGKYFVHRKQDIFILRSLYTLPLLIENTSLVSHI